MDLSLSIGKLPMVGPIFERRLEKLGIFTIYDLLLHIPSRYENFSLISKIGELQEGEIVTTQGKITNIKNEFTRKRKFIQKAVVADETGSMNVVWFNQPFLIKTLIPGTEVSLSGKVDSFAQKLVLESPEYEIINGFPIHTGRLVPIYPETKGITSRWLRRQIYTIIEKQKQKLFEYIPYSIIRNNNLISLLEAIEQVHFPKTLDNAERARYRLTFDELFLMQLSSLQRRNEWNKNLVGYRFAISKFKKEIQEFWKKLPFQLTKAQKKAVGEIFADLSCNRPMNRLLEGDVGSGKTVVSAIAMYLASLNGFQSILMAPTEILANQHYETISKLLTPFGLKTGLITGSSKQKRPGKDIIVGTHAVLSQKINFGNLGLVVIDEQQRFGVEQRAIIRSRGKNPHFLTMTATPIPRTIALTLYGDLDLSFLDEMPHGRKKVKTWLVPPEKRESAYQWISSQLSRQRRGSLALRSRPKAATFNSQLFVICPFIEESESLKTVKAATKEYERLKREVFFDFKLGLLHGKLKTGEKEKVLKAFRLGQIDILVATPVVEVGIDIPNATVIVIEGAERFGLAQLHQLRGRVGRGDKQSYCLLFTESKAQNTLTRLKAMETMYIGAELAELDLKLRGPGEIYGTRQHGTPTLKVASFSNFPLIELTRKEAEKIFPEIHQYPLLKEKLKTYTIHQVAPD